jgi:lipoprotein-releasing system ATP-binding protein
MVRIEGLHKTYGSGPLAVPVFTGFSTTVARGELLGVVGPSGSGKSTLLNLIGGLDRPDAGTIVVDGTEITALSHARRAAFRRDTVAFVFQFHHLLNELTLLENAGLPLLIRGRSRREALASAREALERVGIAHLGHRHPQELSGGEQQRGCLARAVAASARLVLLDEPTGSLDPATAGSVMEVFADLHLKNSWTSIIVTHNEKVACRCDRLLRLP